jgi:hypothetical protein
MRPLAHDHRDRVIDDVDHMLELALEAMDELDGSLQRASGEAAPRARDVLGLALVELDGMRTRVGEIRTMLGILGAAAGAPQLSLEPTDLRDAIDHAISLAAPLLRDRMMVIDAGDRPVVVMATDALATLAIFLLLLEAVGTSHPNSRRSVEVSAHRHHEVVEISVRELGPRSVRVHHGNLSLLIDTVNLLGGRVVVSTEGHDTAIPRVRLASV